MSLSDNSVETLSIRRIVLQKNNQRKISENESIDDENSTVGCNVTSYRKISKKQLIISFDLEVHVVDSGKFEFLTIVDIEEMFIFSEDIDEKVTKDISENVLKNNASLAFKPALNKVSSLYNMFISDSGLVRDSILDIAESLDFNKPIDGNPHK